MMKKLKRISALRLVQWYYWTCVTAFLRDIMIVSLICFYFNRSKTWTRWFITVAKEQYIGLAHLNHSVLRYQAQTCRGVTHLERCLWTSYAAAQVNPRLRGLFTSGRDTGFAPFNHRYPAVDGMPAGLWHRQSVNASALVEAGSAAQATVKCMACVGATDFASRNQVSKSHNTSTECGRQASEHMCVTNVCTPTSSV